MELMFVGSGTTVFQEVFPEMPEGTCIRRLVYKNPCRRDY
jgi:hypothetical protein